MGEKAATNEVINRLLLLLGDTNDTIRLNACETLGKMGEKAVSAMPAGVKNVKYDVAVIRILKR
jgi:hypothetical protein